MFILAPGSEEEEAGGEEDEPWEETSPQPHQDKDQGGEN